MAEVAHVIWMKNAADTPTYKESDISLPEKQDPSVGLPLMSGENKFSRLEQSSHIPLYYPNNGDDPYCGLKSHRLILLLLHRPVVFFIDCIF